MTIRRITPDNSEHAVDSAIAQVIAAAETLHQARMSALPLADIREDFVTAEAVTDAAIEAAPDAGAAKAPLLRQLRARRDRLIMARLSTDDLDVPDCAQPASLAADGPLMAGLDFERESPVQGPRARVGPSRCPGPQHPNGGGRPQTAPPMRPVGTPEPGRFNRSAFFHAASFPLASTVWVDFSNFHGYLASTLANKLVGTTAAVKWRAVQHHRALPLPPLIVSLTSAGRRSDACRHPKMVGPRVGAARDRAAVAQSNKGSRVPSARDRWIRHANCPVQVP